MRSLFLLMPLLFFPHCNGYGEAGPEFEVASVKPNPDPGSRVWLAPTVGGAFTLTNADPDPDRFRLMLQTHRETRELPIYTLTAARTGLKLPGMHPEGCAVYGDKTALEPCASMTGSTTRIDNEKMSMKWLTHVLSNYLDRPVTDKTGFTGSFAVHPLPSLFTALQQQLGLKLDAQQGPTEVFVIDHAEKPTAN